MTLDNKHDDNQIRDVAACMVICLKNVTEVNINKCFSECENKLSESQAPLIFKAINTDALKLICRDANKVVIEFVANNSSHSSNEKDAGTNVLKDEDKSVYLVNIEQLKGSERISHIVYSSTLVIQDLKSNSTYNITVFEFDSAYGYKISSIIVTTMSDEYKPEIIRRDSIAVRNFKLNKSKRGVNAEVYWKPANDQSCDYDIQMFSTKEGFDHFLVEEIRSAENLYHHVVENLQFNTNYSVGIRGVNKHLHHNRYDELVFETPACWNFEEYNPDTCSPAPLSNLRTTYSYVKDFTFNINVTWDQPKLLPEFYNVRIVDMIHTNEDSDEDIHSNNTVRGELNYAYFPGLTLRGMQYAVVIKVHSRGGIQTEMLHQSLNHTYVEIFRQSQMSLTLLRIVLPILIGILAIVIILYRRLKMKRAQISCTSREIHLRELAQSFNNDAMEIDPKSIRLYDILGEGAFGVVHKGLLLPQNQDVAVKMLKDDPSNDNVEAFFQEITLMKSVDKHENIVGIIGHSTSDCSNMMLITEYCSEGDLLNYLRSSRRYFQTTHGRRMTVNHLDNESVTGIPTFNFEKSSENFFNLNISIDDKVTIKNKSIYFENYHRVDEAALPNLVINKMYNECDILMQNRNPDKSEMILIENPAYDVNLNTTHKSNSMTMNDSILTEVTKRRELSSDDLLKFARQIASGMEFLAKHKIIHRDLAARNVLVCADRTVKIADFGLSRDIYQDNIYLKSGAGRLPLKWLALESMIDHLYTTSSDVWSYGILLYEIVTLGTTPYPNVPVDCLVDFLKAGSRMPKPNNCSKKMYDLMFSCWYHKPDERPTFTDILQKLDYFLANSTANDLIDIDFIESNQNLFESKIINEEFDIRS